MDRPVHWVVGRQQALARAVAIYSSSRLGADWASLVPSQRDVSIRIAEKAVSEWVSNGVLVSYIDEYREADQGGKPLVKWG
jgi:hypothetical protein